MPNSTIWPFHRLSNPQRELRQTIAAQAKQRSDLIDKALAAERAQLEQKTKTKILLLGPSEAGKSTVVKNIQLAFAPASFQARASTWLPVIYLNLVHSVNTILEVFDTVYSSEPTDENQFTPQDRLPKDLKQLMNRIRSKLTHLEFTLEDRLHADSPIPPPLPSRSGSRPSSRSGLHRLQGQTSLASLRSGTVSYKLTQFQSHCPTWKGLVEGARSVIVECASDIISLWDRSEVRSTLESVGMHLEYQPGFFLPDAARICSPDYLPTPGDVLRARLGTLSAEEHRVSLEGPDRGKEWLVYDVGGSRSQRAVWAQYFDDAKIVVYVASLAAFDESLAEDSSLNRLTDSLLLWQNICTNKLLASVDLILFLNKLDILKSKLEDGGILFVDYVNSFKSRPNDVGTVSKYVKDMFISLHKQHSPPRRRVHAHLICAVEPRSMYSCMTFVHEMILRSYVSEISFA